MKSISRIIKHLAASRWHVRRIFPTHSLHAITRAITASELQHMGELRFVVEAGLEWQELVRNTSSRSRALQVFSDLRIWDTENNSGVLIYLLLAERKVEIVADRGISKKVEQPIWNNICRNMEHHFRSGEFEQGVLLGIDDISNLLKQHFPANNTRKNELPDQPTLL